MAKVKLPRHRARIEENGSALRLLIPASRNWFFLIFGAVWLVFWCVGELGVIPLLLSGKVPAQPSPGPKGELGLPGIAVWLLFWTLGGLFMLAFWLWNLSGREEVTLSKDLFSIRYALGGPLSGLGFTREYDLAHVRRFRVSPAPYNPWAWNAGMRMYGIGGGNIGFDFGAKTIRFASGVDEAEAYGLVEAIERRLSPADPVSTSTSPMDR